jgi:hypothetical protein
MKTSHKEMHRIFYMVKGYITSDHIAYTSYDGYIKRLWHNEEAYMREDGFEEVYNIAFSDRATTIYNNF